MGVLAYSPLAQGLLTGKYHCVADCPPGLSRSRYFDQSRSSMSRHGESGCEKELFEALDGRMYLSIHTPNSGDNIAMTLIPIVESNGMLYIDTVK